MKNRTGPELGNFNGTSFSSISFLVFVYKQTVLVKAKIPLQSKVEWISFMFATLANVCTLGVHVEGANSKPIWINFPTGVLGQTTTNINFLKGFWWDELWHKLSIQSTQKLSLHCSFTYLIVCTFFYFCGSDANYPSGPIIRTIHH